MHTSVPREFDYLYEERAAIMQHDGGLTKGEAEQKAWMIVYRRMERHVKRDGTVTFKHVLTANLPPAPKQPPAAEQLELITREQYLDGIKRYLN